MQVDFDLCVLTVALLVAVAGSTPALARQATEASRSVGEWMDEQERGNPMRMSAGSAKYRSMAVAAAVVLVLAALGGVAFAGWLEHGARIFVALAASGLALCM